MNAIKITSSAGANIKEYAKNGIKLKEL